VKYTLAYFVQMTDRLY